MTLLLDPRQRAMLAEMGVRTDFLPAASSDVPAAGASAEVAPAKVHRSETGTSRQRHKHPAVPRRTPWPAWPRAL